MNIQKYSDFKLVTEEEEGLWDTIKYGISKLGRYKAGGKIFGKGETDKKAAQEIGEIMGDTANATLKAVYNQVKQGAPEFPNDKRRFTFLKGVILYGQFYDTIVAAAKKDPSEPGYLDPAIVNKLIENLQKVVKKALDVDLAGVYTVMDSKDNIDVDSEERLFEELALLEKEDEMLNEEFLKKLRDFGSRQMDKLFGKEDGDALARKAGSRQSAKLQGAGDDGTVDSERMKTLNSWRLPLALIGTGASFGALSWLIEYMFPAEKITTLTPEEIQQITQKTIGHVSPGDGFGQTLNSIPSLGVHLTPSSSPDEVVDALSKLGGGDPMKGVEIVTQHGGIFTNPDAAKATLSALVSDPHQHGDTLKEVFASDSVRSGTGKVLGDTLSTLSGGQITTMVVKIIVKWTAKTTIKKGLLLTLGAPILKTLGVILVGAGAVVKLLREKGKRQSRAKTLNDLLQSLKPVPVNQNNAVIPNQQPNQQGNQNQQANQQPNQQGNQNQQANQQSAASIYPIMIKNLKALQSMIITYKGASLEGQGGSEEEKEQRRISKEKRKGKELEVGKIYYFTNKKGVTRKVKLISLTHDTSIGGDKKWLTKDDVKVGELAPNKASVIYPDKDGKYSNKSPEIALDVDKLKPVKEGISIDRFEDMIIEKTFSKGPRNMMVGGEDSYATQALTNVRRSIKSFLDDKMKVDKDSTIVDILADKMDNDTKEGIKELYSNVYEYLFGKYSKTLSDVSPLYKESLVTDKSKNLVFAEKMARLHKRTQQFEGENLYAPLGEFGEDLKTYNETMKEIMDYYKANENVSIKKFGDYFKS